MDEREIEDQRRAGESSFAEWFLLRPNRFSARRSGGDALLLGLLSCVCLLPVGPLAVIRAVRCADQWRAADRSPPWSAIVGGALGVVGTILLLSVMAQLVL